MNARAILAKLRQRQTPTRDELGWFAQALADGQVSDAQAGAFAMAVCLNGLSDVGRVALTLAMRDSGRCCPGIWMVRCLTNTRPGAWAIVCRCCWPRRLPPAGPMCR